MKGQSAVQIRDRAAQSLKQQQQKTKERRRRQKRASSFPVILTESVQAFACPKRGKVCRSRTGLHSRQHGVQRTEPQPPQILLCREISPPHTYTHLLRTGDGLTGLSATTNAEDTTRRTSEVTHLSEGSPADDFQRLEVVDAEARPLQS